MKKRIFSLLLVFVTIFTAISIGSFAMAEGTNEEYAWFPASTLRLTQLAYEGYSHSEQNAIDIAPNGNVFAPFTGKIVYKDANWGYVTLQSTSKVHYADGTYDYMTVGFMHDEDISDLYVGKVISQGTAFYQAGGMGEGNPNKYADHVHITVHKGKVTRGYPYGTGDTFAFNAFYINTAKTKNIVNKGVAVQSINKNYPNAPSNYNNLWKNLPSDPTSIYLSKCTSYPSYCTVKTTTSTTLKTLPCAASTDASSANVDTLGKGVTLTATALYKNSVNHYWYKTSYNGKTCYVFAGDTTVTAYNNDVTISGEKSPSVITPGKSFTIEGVVSASKCQLTSISGYIFKAGVYQDPGNATYKEDAGVSNNSYSLKNSAIDLALLFNKLSSGNYIYAVEVAYRNYYSVDGTTLKNEVSYKRVVNQPFVVSSSHSHSYSLKSDDAYHWYICSCGNIKDKASHTYGDWTVTKAATCIAEGTRTHKCNVCGFTQEETVPATGQHSYQLGKCQICGAADPDYNPAPGGGSSSGGFFNRILEWFRSLFSWLPFC